MDRLKDSERELALHYAPREKRAGLRALWAIDERMGAIVASTSEPAIGEMRLLWWREALEGLETKVPAEPLLGSVAERLGGDVALAASWGAIAEGWHALLEQPIDEAGLERFGRERGGRLFAESAAWLGASTEDIERVGAGWALADLAANSADESLARQAAAIAGRHFAATGPDRWPTRLRALGALVVLARGDISGDPRRRRQGSPRRVARMAWHRLTGR